MSGCVVSAILLANAGCGPTSESGAQSEVNETSVDSQLLGIANSTKCRTVKKLSVKDCGAKGDGETDDTKAIQEALKTDSKEIYFPPGTYRVKQPDKPDRDPIAKKWKPRPALTSVLPGRRIFGEGVITAKGDFVHTVFYITGDKTVFSLSCAGNKRISKFVHIHANDTLVTGSRITDLYSPKPPPTPPTQKPTPGESVRNRPTAVNGVRITLDGLTGGATVSGNYFSDLESEGDGKGANGIGMSRAILIEADRDIKAPIIISNNRINRVVGEEGDAINVINSDRKGTFFKSNLLIQNNKVKDFSRRGIKIQTSGAIIQNNLLQNTWTEDQGNMQGAIDLVQGGDHVVIGNRIANCKFIAQIKVVENVTPVSNIRIIANVITGLGKETEKSLIYVKTLNGSNVTISNNEIRAPTYNETAVAVSMTDQVFVLRNRIKIAATGTPLDLSDRVTNFVLQNGKN